MKDRIMCPPLLLYDFECDTEDGTHKPNHVEIILLKIDEELTHDYDKCFVESCLSLVMIASMLSASGCPMREIKVRPFWLKTPRATIASLYTSGC